MKKRLLIVNADDFGIHEDVNRGIIKAYRHGLVRSASIMANMPAFDHAVRLAKEAPGLEVGLHLNVTSGSCCAPRRLIPLLINGEDLFSFSEYDIPTSMQRYRALAESVDAFAEQIRIEGEYQFERLLRRGLSPGHLTVHHYLSLLHPKIFATYIRLAEAIHLPCRAISRPIADVFGISEADKQAMSDTLATSTVCSPQESISNLLDGSSERWPPNIYRDRITERLRSFCEHDDLTSLELVTHPVKVTPIVRTLDTVYLWARELETALVSDEVFIKAVSNLGFFLGGYQQLSVDSHQRPYN